MKERQLLLEIAGFLTLLSNGMIAVPPHVCAEANALIEKIGKLLAAAPEEPPT